MTVLDTLNFVAFNPLQNNNPIAIRRRKLIAKDSSDVVSYNHLRRLDNIYTTIYDRQKGENSYLIMSDYCYGIDSILFM